MTIDLSHLPAATRQAQAARICRSATTPDAFERIITDQLDEASDKARRLARLIRTAREVDTAAAEARKGMTVEQIVDDGFEGLLS